jgi:hypothetical protein
MQPVDVTYLGLESMVAIANKEHLIKEEFRVRVSSQLGFEVTVSSSPVRVPTTPIHITYRALFSVLVANGDIEYGNTILVSMGELSLQPLHIIGKSWTD